MKKQTTQYKKGETAMRKFEVRPETRVEKEDGYFIVRNINEAGLCFCDEYTMSDDDPNEMVKEDRTAMLTKQDIARYMHEATWLNYNVIIERG